MGSFGRESHPPPVSEGTLLAHVVNAGDARVGIDRAFQSQATGQANMMRVIQLGVACVAVVVATAEQVRGGLIIEDFESGDLSAYTVVGGGTGGTVSGQYAFDGSFGLGTNTGAWLYRDDASVQLSQGDTFSVWTKFDNVTEGRAYFGFGSSSAGTLSFVLSPNTGDIRFQANPNFSFTELNSSAQSFAADQWYRAEVVWGVGGSLTGNLYGSDGTTLLNTVNASSSLFTSGGIAFRGFSGVKAFDTVEVQNGVAPVPEPSTLAIFGIGACVVGFGVSGRRRRESATKAAA